MITVYPEYNTIEECGMIAVLNAEEQFNEMMESIGKDELKSVLESGVEALNESDNKVKQIFDKIVDWFKKRWEDIQGLFEKFLKKIDTMIKDHRAKKIDKLAPKMKEIVKKLKEKDKDGKEKVYGKTFEYNGLDKYLDKKGKAYTSLDKQQKYIKEVVLDINDTNKEAEVEAEIVEKFAADKVKEAIIHDITGSNSKDYKDEIRKDIRGKEVEITKKYICDHIDDIIKDAIDPNRVKKEVAPIYKGIKKEIDDTIKYIKKHSGNDNSARTRSLVKLIPAFKAVQNMTSVVSSVVLSELGKKKRTSSMLVHKLRYVITLREKKGNEETAATNESTVYTSSTFQTELTSLFNF